MRSSVLVTHPGRQHSHRAALALEKAGKLAGYWAGVPSLEIQRGLVPAALWRRFVRYSPLSLPPDRARAAAWVPALRGFGDRLPTALATRIDFALCRAFDRWAARRLAQIEAGAVLACEISAHETFKHAKRLGWFTLLDAPAIHHATQDRLHGHREPVSVHRRIVTVKDAEIALADAIVTVSSLARESYLEAGVAPEKVLAVPLGADLEIFGRIPPQARGGECRFLFAGAAIERKGFDLLIAALARLVEHGVPFHLRLVGPRAEQSGLVERLPPGRWSSAGPLPQAGLAEELAAADLLVLPSRSDSFGMVVPEALAAGIPALVSDQVGARELVEEGVTGWVVPAGDASALAEALERCARDPTAVRGLAGACRERARAATWAAYEERFLAALAPILERGPK